VDPGRVDCSRPARARRRPRAVTGERMRGELGTPGVEPSAIVFARRCLYTPERGFVPGSRRRLVELMPVRWMSAACVAVALALAGCGVDEIFLPGADASATAQPTGPAARAGGRRALGAAPGDTSVARRASQLEAELAQVRETQQRRTAAADELIRALNTESQVYARTADDLAEHLRRGTMAGNPTLVAQWSEAQGQYERMTGDLGRLRLLSAEIGGDRSLAAFLHAAARSATELSGGTDADLARLTRISTELTAVVQSYDALSRTLDVEIAERSRFLDNESNRLKTLLAAVERGSFAARPRSGAALFLAPGSPGIDGRRPLFLVRFDRTDVAFEQPLYEAVKQALDRRPDIGFQLIAVTPQGASSAPARDGAAKVLRALVQMGLPTERVALAARTSPEAGTPEVHLYLAPVPVRRAGR